MTIFTVWSTPIWFAGVPVVAMSIAFVGRISFVHSQVVFGT